MSTPLHELDIDLSFHPIQNENPQRFSREQIAQYNRDGFIAGITLFEGERLRALQGFFAQAKEELTKLEKFQSFHHLRTQLYDIVTDQILTSYLRDLLGPNIVCFVSQYVCKEPGDLREVVWHQDAAYNPVDAKSVIVWLAINDAFIENGCMWFVPGSHHRGLAEFQARGSDEDTLGGKEIQDAEEWGKKIPVELKAGQAVFFSDLLLHSSPGNRSATQPRGGFTMTFASAESKVHHDPRFNVSNRESVLCSGEDANNNWSHHGRPE